MPTPTGHITMRVTTHGWFQTSAESFDRLMAEYLPASPAELRDKLQRYADENFGAGIDYSDLTTVTECLMVLAELRGYATN
jgi:hypothetical protein